MISPSFWIRYRQWRYAVFMPLFIVTFWLTRGDVDDSPRMKIGIGLSLLLGLAYLVEELAWMAQKQGRPCSSCGERVRVKSFSPRIHCPRCGHSE
jgi:ribosomal protein S27AE